MYLRIIESIAVSQQAEDHERAARLRRAREVRGQARRARRASQPPPTAEARSILSRLRLPAHPA